MPVAGLLNAVEENKLAKPKSITQIFLDLTLLLLSPFIKIANISGKKEWTYLIEIAKGIKTLKGASK